MALNVEPRESFTTFPLSRTLTAAPSSPEDATFSILPRYLLQKVKDTFAASPASTARDLQGDVAGRTLHDGAPRSRQTSYERPPSSKRTQRISLDSATGRRPSSPALNGRHPHLASIQEGSGPASSVGSRSPRMSTASFSRRSAAPLVSKPTLSVASGSMALHAGATSLSRSFSSTLNALPEGTEASSPPPPYSAARASFTALRGQLADDAQSVSSVGGSTLGVTQVFKRLRGETLSREYWMADEAAVDCYSCNAVFNTWRRKHHCRVCGRIFCGNCAANLRPGSELGSNQQQGLVRVCDICDAVWEHKDKEAREHSAQPLRRSGSGMPTSASRATLRISLPLESTAHAPQSQFAASVLFPRSDWSSYNLAANLSSDDLHHLARRGRRYSDASMLIRPDTPDMFEDSMSPLPNHRVLGSPLTLVQSNDSLEERSSPSLIAVTPAPFRKTAADEERPLPSPQAPALVAIDENAQTAKPDLTNDRLAGLGIFEPNTPEAVESSLGQTAPGTASGSVDPSVVGGMTNSSGRPDTPSGQLQLGPSLHLAPIRSRLTSRAAEQVFDFSDVDERRLSDTGYLSNLARSYSRNLSVYNDIIVVEAAVAHTRNLLVQCLKREGIDNWEEWTRVLTPILWRVANDPSPRPSAGDSMDIRQYIKVKRIPGGKPSDSEYVDGVVFTRSLLNKSLPRWISHPRVMLFDYAFQFEQDDSKIFRPEVAHAPERDALTKLIHSVKQHRPQIVLVSKNVSGLALEQLHKAKIVTARNVKESVMKATARCTGAGVFHTYQHFPADTSIGTCQVFRAQTFVHSLIPGKRKTIWRFEGCNRELGATILLRGGDVKTLSKIKRIVRFMTLAAYSLRLEQALLWDQQATIAPLDEINRIRELSDDEDDEPGQITVPTAGEHTQRTTSYIVAKALKPYLTTILSTSPTVAFPPPHSLARLREDNQKIKHLQLRHRQEATITSPMQDDMPPKELVAPVLSSRGGEPEGALKTAAALTRSLSEVSLLSVKPQARRKAIKISADLADAEKIAEAETRRDEHLKIWQARVFRHQDDLSAASHQNVTVLKVVILKSTRENASRICDGPSISRHHYYRAPTDLTLRQYISKLARYAGSRCVNKSCESLQMFHTILYAHGQLRLEVSTETGRTDKNYAGEDIETRSVCKLCGVETDHTILSEEAGSYSFSKYLELCFYNGHLFSRMSACCHNIHQDHVRFYHYNGVQVIMKMSRIDVSDVAFPPLKVRVDAWTQLRMKNEEYRAVQKSANIYWDSVMKRIHDFKEDVLPLEKREAGTQAMQDFLKKAEEDRATLSQNLDQMYEDTPLTKPSEINAARQHLNNLVATWDRDFHAFEQQYIPTDAERARRATSTQLRRLFSDPSSSAPPSPDLRGSFSPMTSRPTSPHPGPISPALTPLGPLPPAQLSFSALLGDPSVPSSSSSSGTASSGALSGMISPVDEIAGLQLDLGKLDLPSLQLTEANVAQLEQEQEPQALPPVTPTSIVDLGETAGAPAHHQAIKADSDGSDSESTVCAEPPRHFAVAARFDSAKSESEDIDTGLAMKPFKLRKPKPVPSIANLVQRFEASEMPVFAPGSRTVTQDAKKQSLQPPAARPGVRRLKSDFTEVKAQRARQSSDDRGQLVLSDGDVPVDVKGHASRISSKFLKSPAKSTRPKSPGGRRRTVGDMRQTATAPASRTGSSSDVASLVRPAPLTRVSTTSSSRTTVGGTSKRSNTSSATVVDLQKDDGIYGNLAKMAAAKAASTANKAPSRTSAAFAAKVARKMPQQPGQTGANRVSTMARHFNQLSREAEREKQRQAVLARNRQTRPVPIPRATATLFLTSKAALHDSDDEEGSSSGADDEMDGDAEDEEDKLKDLLPARTTQELLLDHVSRIPSDSTADTYIYSADTAKQPTRGGMLPSRSVSGLSDISVGSDSQGQSGEGRGGTGTDSGRSIPASPLLSGDSSIMARMANMSESEMSSSGTSDRHTFLMKTLSSIWNYRGAGFTPLEQPMSDYEHLVAGSHYVIREDEPSSIIASGLMEPTYKQELAKLQPRLSSGSAKCHLGDDARSQRGSNWDLMEYPSDVGLDPDEASKKPLDPCVGIKWKADTLSCSFKAFFADQFDALRRNCKCETQYIESLARCVKWDAIGGKSGAAFLKTKDDRFIVKEVDKAEMKALLNWAPRYFEYMSKAFYQELPTVLAKIFGVYRISYRNVEKGRSKRMDVMVMENIFYNKVITRQFDLKGSTRNRHVEVTDDKACVLLDENLIDMAAETPLYVREHTKKHLETALHNDSLFLSKTHIMDYSLIVGVDKSSQEIVVGIVDFLRPYTWDKKLESWVKETTYLGVGNREPTVLNPRMYKQRFREAMSRYFVVVPDRWTSADAYQASQAVTNLTTTQTVKGKAFQAVTEDQQEQYAGGSIRLPSECKDIVPMIEGQQV